MCRRLPSRKSSLKLSFTFETSKFAFISDSSPPLLSPFTCRIHFTTKSSIGTQLSRNAILESVPPQILKGSRAFQFFVFFLSRLRGNFLVSVSREKFNSWNIFRKFKLLAYVIKIEDRFSLRKIFVVVL